VAGLLRLTPAVVTVDRGRFRLSLWQVRLNAYVRTGKWPITVGALGHATPAGLYFVEGKSRKPAWAAPDSEWVPAELRGQVLPFDDERNPFAGGFIDLGGTDGVGVHGTKFDPALGTKASHGCVRMAVDDLLTLYRAVPLGAPVFIY
jgi:lipoprotein-anchoring transpeptidase ErfK/SrfK